jgi:thiol-disulfide isomerase/thioredoxin
MGRTEERSWRNRGSARLASALAVAALLAGCGGAPVVPATTRTTVVSLERIDCADCGERVVSELRRRPGIYGASFDRRRAEITVVSSPTFDVDTEVKSLAAAYGWAALLGEGRGEYVAAAQFPPGADIITVVQDGADVPSLAALAVPGKVTVVDFVAIWCEPCRAMDRHMADVLRARADVAYRRLEVGDWDSPLATRYLKRVPHLPYALVYAPSGALVREVGGLDPAALDAAIDAAARAR